MAETHCVNDDELFLHDSNVAQLRTTSYLRVTGCYAQWGAREHFRNWHPRSFIRRTTDSLASCKNLSELRTWVLFGYVNVGFQGQVSKHRVWCSTSWSHDQFWYGLCRTESGMMTRADLHWPMEDVALTWVLQHFLITLHTHLFQWFETFLRTI